MGEMGKYMSTPKMSVPGSDFKLRATEFVREAALAESSKECAKYCRRAIQLAKGIPVEPTGINSAKDFGAWLEQQGYQRKGEQGLGAVRPGNVIIIGGSKNHVHGHMAIYCPDGLWRSDFVQDSYNPYGDLSAQELEYALYE